MSLAPLVAHFNQQFHRAERYSARAPFALEEGTVIAGFYGIRLESAFETIFDPAGQVLGHQAQLNAFSPRGKSVSPWAPYAVALDEDAIVYLDRLVRTLHVLNAIGSGLAGPLFLEVHPWHIVRVQCDHGAVFEGILRDCGLSPPHIILEIAEAAVHDASHMAKAVSSFRARGFGIALHQRGIDALELERLLALQPDIIKLGRQYLLAAEASTAGWRELSARVTLIREHGFQAFLHGVVTENQVHIARWAGADGYQGSARHPIMDTSVINVPGYGDSGPGHWQTLWEQANPAYRRVRQRDWHRPQVDDWVEALETEIRRSKGPTILVGHSLGCITIAEWALRHWADIQGALLVAPADADKLSFFNTVPLRPLPFPSILVISNNDPYVDLDRARLFAQQWGSRFVNIGPARHINVEAGFGPWPEGENLLHELRAGALRPASKSLPAVALESRLSMRN